MPWLLDVPGLGSRTGSFVGLSDNENAIVGMGIDALDGVSEQACHRSLSPIKIRRSTLNGIPRACRITIPTLPPSVGGGRSYQH
jgi:hypothetical protein